MNWQKSTWNQADGQAFNEFLLALSQPEKIARKKIIIKTKQSVLAIPTAKLRRIAQDIAQGNFFAFLALDLKQFYENRVINGFLICQIADFVTQKKYLDRYASQIDNWALCDLLQVQIKNKEAEYFALAQEYLQSSQPFVRRTGWIIIFNFINETNYLELIFTLLDQACREEHYYVKMAMAWLWCELFIKQRERTLIYLQENQMNSFVINKAISKCRDSYRVSKEDKILLLSYKKK